MLYRGHSPLAQDTLLDILDLTERAAQTVLEHYNEYRAQHLECGRAAPEAEREAAGAFTRKADRTPLTEADLASHRILCAGLAELTPDVPVLSEESTPAEIAARRDWQRLWMVDPLDGTREFLEGNGEFTINIALIDQGRSRVGLLYQPVKKQAWLGVVGEGAWSLRRGAGGWTPSALHTRRLPPDTLVVLASRRHRNDRLATALEVLGGERELERRNSGSALKFCDLAAGFGDCYPRFSPCSEWDVAAGDALVTAAGGAVLGIDGQPLRYNARASLLSPHFVAVGDTRPELWAPLLHALH
jgi:3'(2'), 5'-bisphosphate nucleotidase